MVEHPITEKELTASLKSLKDTKVKGCYANSWAIIYEADVKEKKWWVIERNFAIYGGKMNERFFDGIETEGYWILEKTIGGRF